MEFTPAVLDWLADYLYLGGSDPQVTLKRYLSEVRTLAERDKIRGLILKLGGIPKAQYEDFLDRLYRAVLWQKFYLLKDQLLHSPYANRSGRKRGPIRGQGVLALQRFYPSTRHMVIVSVKKDRPPGDVQDVYRCFLSDGEYREAREKEQNGEIVLLDHQFVEGGELHLDPHFKTR